MEEKGISISSFKFSVHSETKYIPFLIQKLNLEERALVVKSFPTTSIEPTLWGTENLQAETICGILN